MSRRIRSRVIAGALLSSLAVLSTCVTVVGGAAAATKANSTLTILVTNDDGVSAPGIDAAVQALLALPHTRVIVVAPLTNQSGTGPKVTGGTLTATSATTASGYPAKAVTGYPSDTVIWATDDHGVSSRPDLVVSGINLGENIGPFVDESGTVGAAETALARGIPALAVSQGVDNGTSADFSQGAKYLVHWVQAHRMVLVAAKKGVARAANGNLNVPTCATGHIRGPLDVTVAASFADYSIGTVNCSDTGAKPKTDVQAFVDGFAGISKLRPVNPPH